jgi:transcriptional regulator with XRE-family HTH domain
MNMTIYERIRQLRISAGMSQDDLARALGYSDRSMITKIESGKVDISQKKILAFAEALDTTPAYLMGWEEESDSDNYIKLLLESKVERELLETYRSLSLHGKNLLMDRAKELKILYGKKSEDNPAQSVQHT